VKKEENRCNNCLHKMKSTGDLPCAKCSLCFGNKDLENKWEPVSNENSI
jgi:tRNA(Ile2) C34 agmatinyltransferase TiaS